MLSKGKRMSGGKSAKWPELEVNILKWVEGHRQNGFAVTTKMIPTHSLKLYHDHNIEDFESGPT
jgi:hypothetical protein